MRPAYLRCCIFSLIRWSFNNLRPESQPSLTQTCPKENNCCTRLYYISVLSSHMRLYKLLYQTIPHPCVVVFTYQTIKTTVQNCTTSLCCCLHIHYETVQTAVQNTLCQCTNYCTQLKLYHISISCLKISACTKCCTKLYHI